jgi:CRISPR-associated protein (TIGR02584 family)
MPQTLRSGVRDILVALCGTTPQVVTETLWALGRRSPPVVPDEIWILTTTVGRDACRKALLGQDGAVARYFRDYPVGQRRPRFDAGSIVVLRGADGAPLEDVRSEADSAAVADQIADFLRRLTARTDARLHCSAAGGRKTMGILLTQALQLYGRADDRLHHVLVAPEFENRRDFFYPPRQARKLTGRAGANGKIGRVVVELAEIPYVRLRPILEPEWLTESAAFTKMVTKAQRELQAVAAPEPVCLEENSLVIGKTDVKLTRVQMGLYTALARVKKRECLRHDLPVCGDCTECYLRITQANWRDVKERLAGLMCDKADLPQEMQGFLSQVSRIKRALISKLDSQRVAERYQIRAVGSRNAMNYGLAVDKTLIIGA